MSEEGEKILMEGCSVSLEYQTPFQSRKVNLEGVKIRHVDRDGQEWAEATSESSWHFGYGRTPEAAILGLLAYVIGVDAEDIG